MLNKPTFHNRPAWHKSSEIFVKENEDAKKPPKKTKIKPLKNNRERERETETRMETILLATLIKVFYQFHCERGMEVYSDPHFHPLNTQRCYIYDGC